MTPEQIFWSLASGLIGSLVGAGAVLIQDHRARRHLAASAGRAVFLELIANVSVLEPWIDRGRLFGAVTESIWQNQLPVLAGALTLDRLTIVAMAYTSLPGVYRLADDWTAGSILTDGNRDELGFVVDAHKRAARLLASLYLKGQTTPEATKIADELDVWLASIRGPAPDTQHDDTK